VPGAVRRQRLPRLFRFSVLGEFEGRLAGALSGGMKQKLSLCCALIHHPRLLLLDEPTFGVDPISRRDLWLILHEMVDEGVTVVVSTSYLDEAERCDRVLLLNAGSVLALDAPERLQRSLPGHLFAVGGAEPLRARDVLAGLPGVRRAAVFGASLHVLVQPGSTGESLAAALAAGGVAGATVEPVEASLEDVFIERVPGSGGASHA
jgi:ABC-2 type transport system ATP-binding protein